MQVKYFEGQASQVRMIDLQGLALQERSTVQ